MRKPGTIATTSRPEHDVGVGYAEILTDFKAALGVAAAVFVALIGFLGIAWQDKVLAPRTVTFIYMLTPWIALPVALLGYRILVRAWRLRGRQPHRLMPMTVTITSLVVLLTSSITAIVWFELTMADIASRIPLRPMSGDVF